MRKLKPYTKEWWKWQFIAIGYMALALLASAIVWLFISGLILLFGPLGK